MADYLTEFRNCVACGTELKVGAKFCTGCGRPIRTSLQELLMEDEIYKNMDDHQRRIKATKEFRDEYKLKANYETRWNWTERDLAKLAKESRHDKIQILMTRNSDCENCDICKANANKVIPLKEAVVGVNVPPFHKTCFCWISPYLGDIFKDIKPNEDNSNIKVNVTITKK